MVIAGGRGSARKHIMHHVGKRPHLENFVAKPYKKRAIADADSSRSDYSDSDEDEDDMEGEEDESEQMESEAEDEGEEAEQMEEEEDGDVAGEEENEGTEAGHGAHDSPAVDAEQDDEADAGNEENEQIEGPAEENDAEENDAGEESEQEAVQDAGEAPIQSSEEDADDEHATDELATAALFDDDDADADDEADPEESRADADANDEDDDGDEDDDEEVIYNLSGEDSPSDVSDSDSNELSDDFNDGFGEDCIGDSDDREYLNSLTMLERETILSERYEARRRREENRKLNEEIRRQEAAAKGVEVTRGGRRKRKTAIKAEQKNAEVISAARAEKQRRQQEKRQKQRDKEMQEAAAATVAVASSSDEMLEEDAESEEMSMSSPEEYDDNEDSSKCYSDDEWATLDDLQKLRIKRSWLVSNYDEPFFAKAVTRRFVRYTLGFDDNDKPIYRICEIDGVEKSKTVYPFERIKDANKRLRVSFPDYRAKKPFRAVKMSRVSNKPFTESEYNFWRTSQKRSLNLAQEDRASDATLKPFRQWTKRRVDNRVTGFAKCIAHVYKDDANLDKLIEQRMKKRRYAHNSAYMILDLQNKIKAAENEIKDLQVAHEQELWSRFQADLKYEDASIEKTDRDWVEEKAKWNSLSLEDKRRKHFVPQDLIDVHDEKIEEKKKSIAKMQKKLNATQAQKRKEKRESKKLSKEESGINTNTRQKLNMMRRLQQQRYRTNARQIKREAESNRFRRYETRPTMLWATKKTAKKNKDSAKAAASPANGTSPSLGKLARSVAISKSRIKRKLKSPHESNKKKKKKKKHKSKNKMKKKVSLSGGMSLKEWRRKSQMRHHGTIQP